METQITIFNNPQFGDIRTAGTADKPLFCLADVCKALDLQPSAVMRRLDDGVISSNPIPDSLGRQQVANFVNEDGLYDVILDSRKSEAKTFRKWITSDVLPSIRKTGSYSLQSGYLPDFSNPAEAARAWADQYEKVQIESKRALEAESRLLRHRSFKQGNGNYYTGCARLRNVCKGFQCVTPQFRYSTQSRRAMDIVCKVFAFGLCTKRTNPH